MSSSLFNLVYRKGRILPLPRKVTEESLKTTELQSAIAAKACIALFLNRIQLEIEKMPRKKSERFSEKSIHDFTYSDNPLNH